jgi:hypothetical protein
MGQIADAFHLTVDVPLYLVKRPRLWRLCFGLVSFPLGFSLLWIPQATAYWQSKQIGDAQTAGLIFLLLGIFYAAKSALDELLHVHRVSFSKHGMHLIWSHAPQIFGCRVDKERLFHWSDLETLVWVESNHEHALAQHLEIELKQEIGLSRNRIKVLVSDDRNSEHCEKLMTFLPETFTAPEWLDVARKKKLGGLASSS